MCEYYSEQWENIIKIKTELDNIIFDYNKLDRNIRKNDLHQALSDKNHLKRLPILKMMAEGYFFSDSLELVLDELVMNAVIGHEECAAYASKALNHVNMKKWKKEIIQLIFMYTDNNLSDSFVFHQAWHLMYNLGFKEALLNYIEKYEEYMEGELDEEDIRDIKDLYER